MLAQFRNIFAILAIFVWCSVSIAHATDCSNYYNLQCNQIPSIPGNIPPRFDGFPIGSPSTQRVIRENEPFSFQFPQATDLGDTLTYTLWGRPKYASFDEATGIFQWTPGYSATNGREQNGRWLDASLYLRAWDSSCACVQYTLDLKIESAPYQTRIVNPPIMYNNSPFFFVAPSGIPFLSGGIDQFQRFSQSGFKVISTQGWGRFWDFERMQLEQVYPVGHPQRESVIAGLITQRRNLVKRYLNHAQNNGLKVILTAHQPEVLSDPEINSHPALLAIELPDEPDLLRTGWSNPTERWYFEPENMQFLADQARQAAPHIPVIINLSARFVGVFGNDGDDAAIVRRMYEAYAQAADIVSFDYYLLGSSGQNLPSQQVITQTIEGLVYEARQLLTKDAKPLMLILEAVNYSEAVAPDLQTRPVTSQLLRLQMKSAMEAGVSAIRLYGSIDYGDNNQDGILDYHPFEVTSELEDSFPVMNRVINQGIDRIFLGYDLPLLSPFYLQLRLIPAAAAEFYPSRFVWELSSAVSLIDQEMNTANMLASNLFSHMVRVTSSDNSNLATVAYMAISSDSDGIPTLHGNLPVLIDSCLQNPDKMSAGVCGCSVPDLDANLNGIMDCRESADAITPDDRQMPAEPQIPIEPQIPELGKVRFKRIGSKLRIAFPSMPGIKSYALSLKQGSKKYKINAQKPRLTIPFPGIGIWKVRLKATFDPFSTGTVVQRITTQKVRL